MFGLRGRVEHLASRLVGLEFLRKCDLETMNMMEEKIEVLTKALEWHVGVTVEIMNMEEQLIMARVDHHKERGERFGEDGEQVAQQTCDGINQSVERKLNNDVSANTDKSENDR